MNKRGQVTIFVIVGIIILLSVFLVFYFLGDKLKKETTPEIVFEEASLEPMIKLVEDCVKEEVAKGVELVGLQGGYYNPPKYYQLGDYQVAYDCHKDGSGTYINRLPTLSRISQEIEEYISDSDNLKKIEECIDGFNAYKNQGYKIDYKNIREMVIDINIDQNIIVDVDYPVEVKRGDFQSSFRGVKFDINSGLINAYKVAVDIINDECTGTIFNIDNYITNEPPLSFIERELAPDAKLFYYLTTIPKEDEGAYKFHFIIER